jgi:Bacterial pre-peptidase C-terminal domain
MKAFAAILALSFLATPALAQQIIDLSAGFTPDPYTASVIPGGPNLAGDFDSNCNGRIAADSDFILDYTAGGFPLTIRVNGSTDTTLMIIAPDGNTYCDDDSAGNYNPEVTFSAPQTGVYSIWVGAIGDAEQATLVITETD